MNYQNPKIPKSGSSLTTIIPGTQPNKTQHLTPRTGNPKGKHANIYENPPAQ